MEFINLHYGYQETESGIYHAFETTDEGRSFDSNAIADRLASVLDVDWKDPDSGFNWNTMMISLPEETVSRIWTRGYYQAIALSERGFGDGPWRNDACKGYAIMAMKRAGLDNDTIRKVNSAMTDCFDDTTVEAASRYYMNGVTG